MSKETYISKQGFRKTITAKLKDYHILVKFRLSFIVVFSSGIGYLFAGGAQSSFFLFLVGGFLITAASNALNQIIESDTDKLMGRTANRPLATGRMQHTEAIIAAGLMAIAGIAIFWMWFNTLAALLGALSLISYAFLYTPMKKVSPIAVFIGAFPGAMPPLIGCAAASGGIDDMAILLFCVQFVWQFPHFWAIAWVLDDDYKKAGFQMLPSGGRDKSTAFQVLVYTLFLLPISLSPVFFHMAGSISAIVIAISGIIFVYQAYNLYTLSLIHI